MNINVNFDVIAYFEDVLSDVKSDVNYAYNAFHELDDERAHVALTRIEGRVGALESFLQQLKASQPE